MKRAARCIRRLFPLPVAAGILALLLVSTACGNNDPGAAPSADAEDESSDPGEAAPVIWPGRIFSIDDVVAAGWKKSKQFSTETVPYATDIWYGFFNRKDVEVRFYESHEDAVQHGIAPAEEAVGRIGHRGGERLLDFGGASIAKYAAYAVAGNLVMLCETEIAVCQSLLDQLD